MVSIEDAAVIMFCLLFFTAPESKVIYRISSTSQQERMELHKLSAFAQYEIIIGTYKPLFKFCILTLSLFDPCLSFCLIPKIMNRNCSNKILMMYGESMTKPTANVLDKKFKGIGKLNIVVLIVFDV